MYKVALTELLEICKQQQAVLEILDMNCSTCEEMNINKAIDFDWVNENITAAEQLLQNEEENIY